MRGIAIALVAFACVSTTTDPAAAQCYGPECDLRQSNGPSYHNERPDFRSYQGNGQFYRSSPYEQGRPYRQAPNQGQQYQGQPYRSMPYEQAQPYQQSPYQGQQYQSAPYRQGQPYQGQQYQGQPYQGQPYQQMPPQQAYRGPGYQSQPRPPAGYSNVPPGMSPNMSPGMGPGGAPHGYYQQAYPNGRMDVQTRVVRITRPTKLAARQQQPASSNRTVVKSGSNTTGSGQVTISTAEYRELQNQARELQRLRSSGAGAPPSPFPQVPPAPSATPPAAASPEQ